MVTIQTLYHVFIGSAIVQIRQFCDLGLNIVGSRSWTKSRVKVIYETYNPSNSCQLYLVLFILASFNNLRVDLEMNGQGQGH